MFPTCGNSVRSHCSHLVQICLTEKLVPASPEEYRQSHHSSCFSSSYFLDSVPQKKSAQRISLLVAFMFYVEVESAVLESKPMFQRVKRVLFNSVGVEVFARLDLIFFFFFLLYVSLAGNCCHGNTAVQWANLQQHEQRSFNNLKQLLLTRRVGEHRGQ